MGRDVPDDDEEMIEWLRDENEAAKEQGKTYIQYNGGVKRGCVIVIGIASTIPVLGAYTLFELLVG